MLNKTQLLQLIQTNLPDNATQQISAEDLRDVLDELVDSQINIISNTDYLGLSDWSSTLLYATGEACVYNKKIYRAITNPTQGTWNDAQWEQISSYVAFEPDEYIMRKNGIEMTDGKLAVTLETNYPTPMGIDSGYYVVLVNDGAIAGESLTYPELGTIFFQKINTGADNSTLMLAYVADKEYIWMKAKSQTKWVKVGGNQSSSDYVVFNTLAERDAILAANRKRGLMVTTNNNGEAATRTITHRYDSSDLGDANWTNKLNWTRIAEGDNESITYYVGNGAELSAILPDLEVMAYQATIVFTGSFTLNSNTRIKLGSGHLLTIDLAGETLTCNAELLISSSNFTIKNGTISTAEKEYQDADLIRLLGNSNSWASDSSVFIHGKFENIQFLNWCYPSSSSGYFFYVIAGVGARIKFDSCWFYNDNAGGTTDYRNLLAKMYTYSDDCTLEFTNINSAVDPSNRTLKGLQIIPTQGVNVVHDGTLFVDDTGHLLYNSTTAPTGYQVNLVNTRRSSAINFLNEITTGYDDKYVEVTDNGGATKKLKVSNLGGGGATIVKESDVALIVGFTTLATKLPANSVIDSVAIVPAANMYGEIHCPQNNKIVYQSYGAGGVKNVWYPSDSQQIYDADQPLYIVSDTITTADVYFIFKKLI